MARILLKHLTESLERAELSPGGLTMTPCLLAIVLGVSAALGLLLPLPPGAAAGITKTLAQTPVTGHLAHGGTFHGRLTVQTVTVETDGQLVAAGVLSRASIPAAGRPHNSLARPVAAPDAMP